MKNMIVSGGCWDSSEFVWCLSNRVRFITSDQGNDVGVRLLLKL